MPVKKSSKAVSEAPLSIAEVGAYRRRSREDLIRRTAALIEILEIDPEFAARRKDFDAINLADGRDFLEEDDTYDMVILHSIYNPRVIGAPHPGIEKECLLSWHHNIEAWRGRLLETDAEYIVVAEGQPFTLSGWDIGNLPGYRIIKRDQWLTVYKKS